jgi:hypothetical protein
VAETKTKPSDVSVDQFLESVTDATQREDSKTLIHMMHSITGEPARMWGSSLIGFGTYHYVYASGHEGDICLSGFSPRKNALTIYLLCGASERFGGMLSKLGKAKMGKGCLYIKKLADIDLDVLREMIQTSVVETLARPKPVSKAGAKSKAAAKPKIVAKSKSLVKVKAVGKAKSAPKAASKPKPKANR